jgi:hypothetical protein
MLPVIGVLVIIALAATVVALASQTYFGRLPPLAWFGQALAATGAAVFALWLKRRR